MPLSLLSPGGTGGTGGTGSGSRAQLARGSWLGPVCCAPPSQPEPSWDSAAQAPSARPRRRRRRVRVPPAARRPPLLLAASAAGAPWRHPLALALLPLALFLPSLWFRI